MNTPEKNLIITSLSHTHTHKCSSKFSLTYLRKMHASIVLIAKRDAFLPSDTQSASPESPVSFFASPVATSLPPVIRVRKSKLISQYNKPVGKTTLYSWISHRTKDTLSHTPPLKKQTKVKLKNGVDLPVSSWEPPALEVLWRSSPGIWRTAWELCVCTALSNDFPRPSLQPGKRRKWRRGEKESISVKRTSIHSKPHNWP